MDKVQQALIGQILAQLESIVSSIFFNRVHAAEWLQQGYGLESDVSRKTAGRLERTLQCFTIEISDLTFPEPDNSEALPVYGNILRKLKRIRFKNCSFGGKELSLPGVTQWFENCSFRGGWVVHCTACNHGYTEPNDLLFDGCDFNGDVLIADKFTDETSLKQYSCLFWNCSVETLNLYGISLNTRLWSTYDGLFKEQPKLNNLSLLSVRSSRALELGCQTFSKIQIASSEVAGINLHGGKVRHLSVSDTECRGACSLEKAEIGNVQFSDSTFERPVNLSRMNAGYLDIKRVDFEKVLACNEVTITRGITLRSVRHAVAPDFVDMNLSAEAKADTDRETFRLIKHSFEAVANRIEANRFFGLEMEAYRRELREQQPWHSRERVLVAFNHAVSRHGQSYSRPLFLLLLTAAVNAWMITNNGWQVPEEFVNEAVQANLQAISDALNNFARGFTLARPVMHPSMEFASLVLALLMSTFLWHFLVAVRRFRRG